MKVEMDYKQAIVTGASKRLGREISLFLASKGYDLLLHYNSSQVEVLELRSLLKEKFCNQNFEIVQYDLSNWKKCYELFNKSSALFNHISLLVNNASIYNKGNIINSDPEQLIQNFSIHLFTPFILIKEFAKRFKKGLVINMIDSAINHNYTTHIPYLLSKRGLNDLTTLAAQELAPSIRVNGISPGPVLPVKGDIDDRFNKVVEQTPLKQPVAVSDILNTLNYFIECESVTGQVINVDSGTHLGSKTNRS